MTNRTLRSLALLLTLAVASCGKDEPAPTAPEANLPPDVVAVHPAARSTGVFYDAEIWADFAEPLDPATVNERTVYLKLDTGRVPVDVSYDATLKRITLALGARLDLRRTYTVELTPAIATADGRRFTSTWFWQFATNSVRLPEHPVPPSGYEGSSPFSMLRWSPTESAAGDIVYELYRGSDSSAVASRAMAPVTVTTALYTPTPRWALGETTYWSVTAVNRSTGEEIAGPVWKFATSPPGAQIDSIDVQPSLRAYIRQADTRVSCNNGGLTTGPNYTCYIRFPFETLSPDLSLAGAEFVMTPTQTTQLPARTPTLWQSDRSLPTCTLAFPGPPYAVVGSDPIDTADPVTLQDRSRFRFRSDALAANVESAIHGYNHTGYLVRTNLVTSWVSPFGSEFDFHFRVYYFRTP